jgi:hypothetical protein
MEYTLMDKSDKVDGTWGESCSAWYDVPLA